VSGVRPAGGGVFVRQRDEMMKYRVKIWCRDCTHQDFHGCGEGSPWYIVNDDPWSDDPKLFDTKEDAESAGKKEASDPRWEYEVEEI